MSGQEPHGEGGPGAASGSHRMTYLADVGQSLRGAAGQGWMVTFTDLVALLLAFFVLLFSMSVVERYKWQNLVRSLAGNMDSLVTREGPKPALEFQIDQDRPAPGTDLDYLTPVIERQLAAAPDLEGAVLWRQDGKTIVTLPTVRLFEGGGTAVSPAARGTVYAMSRLLQTLDNRIEVHGHSAPGAGDDASAGAGAGDEAAGWEASLARAAALSAALSAAGYRGGISARGYGSVRHGEPGLPARREGDAPLDARLDIVIFEDESEG